MANRTYWSTRATSNTCTRTNSPQEPDPWRAGCSARRVGHAPVRPGAAPEVAATAPAAGSNTTFACSPVTVAPERVIRTVVGSASLPALRFRGARGTEPTTRPSFTTTGTAAPVSRFPGELPIWPRSKFRRPGSAKSPLSVPARSAWPPPGCSSSAASKSPSTRKTCRPTRLPTSPAASGFRSRCTTSIMTHAGFRRAVRRPRPNSRYKRYQTMVGDYYGVRWLPNFQMADTPLPTNGLMSRTGLLFPMLPEFTELGPAQPSVSVPLRPAVRHDVHPAAGLSGCDAARTADFGRAD